MSSKASHDAVVEHTCMTWGQVATAPAGDGYYLAPAATLISDAAVLLTDAEDLADPFQVNMSSPFQTKPVLTVTVLLA